MFRYAKFCLLFLWIVLSVPTIDAQVATDQPSPLISRHEQLLRILRIHLSRTDEISDKSTLWSKESVLGLKRVLDHSPIRGGVVTATTLTPNADSISVSYSPSTKLFSVGLGEGDPRYHLLVRSGEGDCQITHSPPLTESNVHESVTCTYTRAVRARLGNSLLSGITEEDHQAGLVAVNTLLTAYQQLLHIRDFQLNQEESSVEIVFPKAESSFHVALVPSRVNQYATPEAERRALTAQLRDLVNKGSFVLLQEEAKEPLVVLRASISQALTRAADESLSNDAARRIAYFNIFGIGHLLDTSTRKSAGIPSSCEVIAAISDSTPYPRAPRGEVITVTPKTKGVVHVKGIDTNSLADDTSLMEGVLRNYGYDICTIDMNSSALASPPDAARALRGAQTILLHAHGLPGRSAILTRDHVVTRNACCERMRAWARTLGLPGYESVYCGEHGADRCDRTGGVCWDYDPKSESCDISLRRNFFSPENLGERAALIQNSCFSGTQVGSFASDGNLMDAVVASRTPTVSWISFANGESEPHCSQYLSPDERRELSSITYYLKDEMRLLANDTKGESQYCIDLDSFDDQENPPREPFNGRSCASDGLEMVTRMYAGSIQGSFALRGTTSFDLTGPPPGLDHNAEQWCRFYLEAARRIQRDHFNQNGFEMYRQLRLSGNDGVAVEFAPYVVAAYYDSVDRVIRANFSSEIVPYDSMGVRGVRVEVEDSECSKTLSNVPPLVGGVSASPRTINFQLSDNYNLIPADAWGLPDEEFRRRYGHAKTDTGHLKVKIRAFAPNGISIVGNEGATSPWFWNVPMISRSFPPYQIFNADENGGQTFALQLACMRPIACEKPLVGRTSAGFGVIGSTCAQVPLDQCHTTVCVSQQSNEVVTELRHEDDVCSEGLQRYSYPGTAHEDAVCCAGPPRRCAAGDSEDCTAAEPAWQGGAGIPTCASAVHQELVAAEDIHCPRDEGRAIGAIFEQWTRLPLDLNTSLQASPPLVMHQVCGGG
ncbi:MAG: hypothetical protein QY326_03300 [Bdellovibrionota bacterium]|nr:MAG: hypothetical protein QY326_03300 [Bdellovibrionota bacterium]